MEIKVLEDKKNKLVIEAEGIGHTYLNLLKDEMWNDKNVKVATYMIKHPIVSKPRMIVEMSDGDPRAALNSAIGRLKKASEKLKKEMVKEAK